MELRRLIDSEHRRLFGQRMSEARAKHGVGFTETPRSQLGRIHLAFAELYALYENDDDPVERMMSGFAMHDLASMPQSYPKPDLTYLRADHVLECGELWSFSKGAGVLARRGCTIVAGLRQIEAILVYPISRPWDGTKSYGETHFTKPCEEMPFPYGQTLDGEAIWVQPMVLEGAPLQALTLKVFELGFETRDQHQVIRFPNPIALRPSLEHPSIPLDSDARRLAVPPADDGKRANGRAGS
ncbi:MAG TPA: hypothetical protein VEJ86_04395 [Candidatus Binataceae bacterium]|nr:hypothetical protein [Candidatus Binataceae bacterium]